MIVDSSRTCLINHLINGSMYCCLIDSNQIVFIVSKLILKRNLSLIGEFPREKLIIR